MACGHSATAHGRSRDATRICEIDPLCAGRTDGWYGEGRSAPPTLAMKGSAAQQKDRGPCTGPSVSTSWKVAGPVLQRDGLSRTTIRAYRGITRTALAAVTGAASAEAIADLNYTQHQPRQRPSTRGGGRIASTTAIALRGGPGSRRRVGGASYSKVIRLVGPGKRTRSSVLPACPSSLAD